MNRFRKRSDAKSVDVPPEPRVPPHNLHEGLIDFLSLQSLPPASDFRTSLILPDLSRRFTILRESSSDAIDVVRSKLAERRANGFQDTITEEEEDMLISALSLIRPTNGGSSKEKNATTTVVAEDTVSSLPYSSSELGSLRSNTRTSVQSSAAFSTSSGSSSFLDPKHASLTGSRSSKRHSSNLFASSHFRDVKVMRKSAGKTGSTRSISSSTASEQTNGSTTNSSVDTERPRPSTPDRNTSVSNDSLSENSGPGYSPSSTGNAEPQSAIVHPLRFPKHVTESQIRRMSAQLQGVLREMEEDAEDKVLVPRSSTPFHQTNAVESSIYSHSQRSSLSPAEEARTKLITDTLVMMNVAVDPDERSTPRAITDMSGDFGTQSGSWVVDEGRDTVARSPSPYQSMGSASPVPRVPGYIPGMPRPMTPRQLDLDDQRSHSTTPRATAQSLNNASLTLLHRRGSNASIPNNDARPTSPTTPLLYRSPTGRVTPEGRRGAFNNGQPLGSPWKRPSSPLSASPFQPIQTDTKLGAPSHATWSPHETWIPNAPSPQSVRPLGRSGTLLAHSRNHSSVSFSDAQDSGETTATEGTKSTVRTVRSSTRIESPFANAPKTAGILDTDARATISNVSPTTTATGSDINSSNINKLRSPSPAQDTNISIATPSPSDQDTLRLYQKSPGSLITPPVSPFSRYPNPLNFSPIHNSSRTSLVSAGSSYHSWDESGARESGFVGDLDSRRDAWHDFPDSTGTSLVSDQKYLVPDKPEAILRRFTGLSKVELSTIQHKLVDALQNKDRFSETRSPSTLRRRRPSTAQSMHSFGGPSRTTSPAPQSQGGVVPYPNAESTAKANALLASVMDSIQQLSTSGIEPRKEEPIVIPIVARDPEVEDDVDPDDVVIPVLPFKLEEVQDSPSRRNKDLADMLFGEGEGALSFSPIPPVLVTEDSETETKDSDIRESPKVSPPEVVIPQTPAEPVVVETVVQEDNKRVSPVPSHPVPDDNELRKQVQEKADAAMAQLHRSPQQARFPSHQSSSSHRKRINPSDISGPRLVQSSTSIEKFPPVPSSAPQHLQRQPPSKLSFGIKRLRNTLKGKNSFAEEITPWTADNSSSSNLYSPKSSSNTQSSPRASPIAPNSTTDLHSYKSNGHSPPGSASGLKGFMSLFRKKGQHEHHNEAASRNASPSTHMYMTSSSSFIHVDKDHLAVPQSAPPLQNRTFMDRPDTSEGRPSEFLPTTSTEQSQNHPFISHAPSKSDPHALSRFFEAASNLGLDHAALSEFLNKSQVQPTSAPEQAPSITVHASPDDSSGATKIDQQNGSVSSSDHTLSPMSEGTLVTDKPHVAQRTSLSPEPTAPLRLRQQTDGLSTPNRSVVRRTIIFPSANGSNTDLSTLVRKMSKGRKRASGISLQSNRSVHDRVPTPPPSRAKRQSIDVSPPVPSLPNARGWISQGGLLHPRAYPETHTEKTTSMYESLYEMYGQHGTDTPDIPRSPTSESMREGDGQALEVIELANGETIWSIVDGLRADDAESVYPRRSSFQSEFSAGAHDSDGEQLFFKEHARTGSKGSNRSGLFRRKTTGPARPETKVFYSSSTQIARLIDQLSKGADAGSFNIIKRNRPGHSHSASLQSESDIHWTVEERIERLEKRVAQTGTAN